MGNREALLNAALECLRDRGYARTTARDVAAAAGVSLGAIGYHFGSTETLLNEAIAEGVRQWLDRLGSVVSDLQAQDLGEATRTGVEESFDLLTSERQLLVAFVEALAQAERSPVLRHQLAQHYAEFRREVATLIEQLLGGVTNSGLDTSVVASLLIALGDGIVIQHMLDPSTAPTSAQLLDVVSSIGALLTRRPP